MPQQSTREARIAERKRKQEALEAAADATGASPTPQRLKTDEIALASDHLTCPICREILDNAVETACAHVYCENCIAIAIANGHKKCAVCRAPIKNSDLRASVPIRRIIADMDTTCTNAGCKWKGTRGNLQDHELSCGHALVQCEYGHEKCGVIRRMDLKKHHVSECLYFICKCTLGCGQSFPRRDLSKHKKVCPNARTKCDSCNQAVRRKEMPHHTEHICPKSKVYCFAGCKGKMLREQLGGHILSNLGPHLSSLVMHMNMREQENKCLRDRMEEQERLLVDLTSTVDELKAKVVAAEQDEQNEEDDDDDEDDDAAEEMDEDEDGEGEDADEDDEEADDEEDEGDEGAEEDASEDGSEDEDEDEDDEDDEEASEDAEEDGSDEDEESGGSSADGDDDDNEAEDEDDAEDEDEEEDAEGDEEDDEGEGEEVELYRLADDSQADGEDDADAQTEG